MWWTNGTSKYVKNADPEREKINKEVSLAALGLTEEDLK